MDIGIKQIVIIRLMETKNFLPSKISLPGIMTSFPLNLRKFKIVHRTAKIYEYRYQTIRYYEINENDQFSIGKINLPGIMTSFSVKPLKL